MSLIYALFGLEAEEPANQAIMLEYRRTGLEPVLRTGGLITLTGLEHR